MNVKWMDVVKTVAVHVGVYGGMAVLGAKISEKAYDRGYKDGVELCTGIVQNEVDRFTKDLRKKKETNSKEKAI